MSIQNYCPEIESQMHDFYNSLSERNRRRYAAIEVTKLGYGGTAYMSKILQCDEKTIRRGQRDFNTELSSETKRVRQKGAGRKLVLSTLYVGDGPVDLLQKLILKTRGLSWQSPILKGLYFFRH